jgi:hypothetical protein
MTFETKAGLQIAIPRGVMPAAIAAISHGFSTSAYGLGVALKVTAGFAAQPRQRF